MNMPDVLDGEGVRKIGCVHVLIVLDKTSPAHPDMLPKRLEPGNWQNYQLRK
jgi:hypothetical protein